MKNYLILRTIVKLLFPLIVFFGLYVQFHGDFSPGGGFQAGAIIAVAFIIYGVVFGMANLNKLCPKWIVHKMMGFGVLLYAGVGIFNMLLGYEFLNYNAFDPAHPSHGQHIGILIVEAGVGITVTGVLISIFYAFAERHPTLEGKDF